MTIGKIGEFKLQMDDWKLYVDRLENYFKVNDVKEELRVATLITVMGAESYELLVNLCTPHKPNTKNFEYLVNVMEKHLQPKPSVLAERFKFRQRKQKEGESISKYMAVLKQLTKFCDFGTWLEESIRDQFVCGINSEVIRQRLFAEDSLDYSKAYSMAMSMEMAEKNAAMVEGEAKSKPQGDGASDFLAIATSSHSYRGGTAARGNKWSRGYRGHQRVVMGRELRHTDGPRAPASKGSPRGQQCEACGGQHDTGSCKFIRYVCRVCNKRGHLQRVCPLQVDHHQLEERMRVMSTYDEEGSDEVIQVNINNLSLDKYPPIYLLLRVHSKDIRMECDTGSAISCINYETYKKMFSDLRVETCNIALRYYTGEIVKPIGVIKPMVRYKNVKKYLDLYIIKNGKTILIGRQWMTELNICILGDSNHVGTVSNNNYYLSDKEFDMNNFSSRYRKVFDDGLGRFTGGTVTIHIKPGARPVFMRARPLAYALREPVERALDQLVRDGVLTPVDRSDWATPIVPVVKKDGTIRICADYKLTLNKVLEVDRYPLPRVEDLLARLHGGEYYSKIDLSQAYAQFELDDSKKYTVINTHKGMFVFNRLVYGLSSSPGIFQKYLEQLFADLPGVGVFLDDIIITGSSNRVHLNNLYQVFDRLQSYGLKVKKEKCSFFARKITYLGHVISKDGVQTCADKVKAIVDTPAPSNVSELRAFIGMTMYYAKFIKNVSTILSPLYRLLRVDIPFDWCKRCEDAFDRVKRTLASSEVLSHYTPEWPIVLTADASSVGVGAVISHLTPAGERPIAYASRSLSTSERAYSQIDREALAIIFGIRKYHQYLYGRKFTLRTDHKPLTYIFGNKVGIPIMAASRLQRWAILLSGYNYDIEYVSSKKNCADALSRLPQSERFNENTDITYLNFVEDFFPITNNQVKKQTARDTLLNRVTLYVQSGWPSCCPDKEIQPYFIRRNELYLDRGCLMWGYRMVIPSSLRKDILKQLHVSHMGIVKTKSLARSYVWWPNIDRDVETICRSCENCAIEGAAPPRAPPQPWAYHTRPWSRLHIDFLGPLRGTTFLVLIDASTKWLDIFEMTRTNASQIIKVLRRTFAIFGLPIELVSDQGPPFTSIEFSNFLKNNGIRQYFSPTYHPSSNGAAENAVKLCKSVIKKAYRENKDIDTALQTFLLNYRNTAQSTTGESPAMLLQRRTLRNRLDLLRADRALEDRVCTAQQRQVQNSGGVIRELRPQDTVWTRSGTKGDKWLKGVVQARAGTREYIIDQGDGRLSRKHVDHIKRRSRLSDFMGSDSTPSNATPPSAPQISEVDEEGKETSDTGDVGVSTPMGENEKGKIELEEISEGVSTPEGPPPIPVTCPKRQRKPVVRFPM